jgi:hypothetical protein
VNSALNDPRILLLVRGGRRCLHCLHDHSLCHSGVVGDCSSHLSFYGRDGDTLEVVTASPCRDRLEGLKLQVCKISVIRGECKFPIRSARCSRPSNSLRGDLFQLELRIVAFLAQEAQWRGQAYPVEMAWQLMDAPANDTCAPCLHTGSTLWVAFDPNSSLIHRRLLS